MSKTKKWQIDSLDEDIIEIRQDISDILSDIEDMKSGLKMANFSGRYIPSSPTSLVVVPIPEYNPEADLLVLYVGGVYQNKDEDYSVNLETKQVSPLRVTEWTSEDTLDFLIFKNIIDGSIGQYDGHLIHNGTVSKQKLTPELAEEIDSSILVSGQVTITNKDWVASGDTTLPLKKNVPITGVTETDKPINFDFTLATYPIAEASGMTYVETYNGGITVFARETPSGTVVADYVVRKG